MFEVSFKILASGALCVAIENDGKGRWQAEMAENWLITISGFDDCSRIIVTPTQMADGSIDMAMVYRRDGMRSEVVHELLNWPPQEWLRHDPDFTCQRMADWVNRKLIDWQSL